MLTQSWASPSSIKFYKQRKNKIKIVSYSDKQLLTQDIMWYSATIHTRLQQIVNLLEEDVIQYSVKYQVLTHKQSHHQ